VAVAVGALAAWTGTASGGSTARTTTPVTTAATSIATPVDPGRALRPPHAPVAVGDDGRCSTRGGPILRVLQQNIHFGTNRSGALDLTALADEIDAVRPDLVSLNEVDVGTLRTGHLDEVRYLAGATGLHAVYGPNLPWQGGVFGNAVLSRSPALYSRNLRLPVTAGLEQRGLLSVTVRIGGRTISFSSVHLSDGDSGRASRVLQARAVDDAVARSPTPTIVAGDLNAAPGDLPVRILRQHLLDAQELGGTGEGPTIPEPMPRNRIDYVLYDNAFAVVPGSTRVVASPSDHRGVFTELALLPPGCKA
jgi:endonuclease/exonuclease/phosphatase family metal-dependent hydrolase